MIKLGNMDYLLELDGGESHATASASPTVLFFGNIRADKGLDILLRAMALVLQEVPAARLMVVGIPRVDMGPYNRLVDQLGIGPAVEFQLRHVKEGELPGIFRSADVVALPYREIDQSGVAVTACTFGRALVATTVGGIKELVEEAGNGILVAPEDPYGLAKALIAVLTDSSLRVGFETRARDYALTALSWDPIAAQLSREYRRLVAGKA
jgi:glycosyltransferase involved in cell wall biosynthesis